MYHVVDEKINDEIFSVWFISDDNYYEVYDAKGNCLTEGELLYKPPTRRFIKKLHDSYKKVVIL